VLPLGGFLNAVRILVRFLPLSLPAPIIIRCVTGPWMQFSFDLLAFFLPALNTDVIAPPTDAEGGLYSEINDNSVAILLTYGTARTCSLATPRRTRRSTWLTVLIPVP